MFENWYKNFLDEMPDINTTKGIAEKAWHARDAEVADLKRQLAERDRIAYPIIGIPSAKDFARQCDPFEPDSETTTGTCAHWRDKVEKVFAQVRSIFDAYVQEKVDRAVLAESEWWHPHAPMHHLDYMKEFGKECPCIKCRRLAANRAKVKT